MAATEKKPVYSLFGTFWRLILGGAVLFAASGAGAYVLTDAIIRRQEKPAPNLVTLTIEQALDRASEEGFALRIERREGTELLDEGRILSQRPNPDMAAKAGATIRVVVATGP